MTNLVTRQTRVYKWYALYTRSRMEKKALRDLELRGVECYLPLKKVKKCWGKQSRTTFQPLIHCYVFVKVSHVEFYDVLMTDGVLWYVCFGGQPAVIPDNQMDNLRLFIEKDTESVEVTSERIQKGDRIRVTEGPLKDACAEVVEIRGRSRLLLRFNSLGCCVHVELGSNIVALLPSGGSVLEANSEEGYCLNY